ncbi:MAG TPA: DUF86 domain-containing protein [Bacteroidia bacterium]|nr:DUF86 domain-containing protein [Bacteroidia bacterium]
MYPSQLEFLRHILDECSFILKVTESKSREEIFADETIKRAIIRSLEIIGEAAKRTDPDFTARHPEIEWKKMAATRDIMIHHYFGIDDDIVWSIITKKLPDLQYHIEQILRKKE